MKRILGIGLALALALILAMAFSAPVFADDGEGSWECWEEEGYLDTWEEEGYLDSWEEVGHQEPDTLFFDNDDFQFALGFDRETGGYGYGDSWTWLPVEKHTGGMFSRPDGHDIYQDDGSAEGWLDKVSIQDGWGPGDYNSYWEDNAFYFDLEPGTYYVVDEEAGSIWVVTKAAGEEWIVTKEAGRQWIPAAPPAETYGIPIRDFLQIMLPGGKTYAEYNGKALCHDVDFNDGTWRIQIPRSTYIMSSDGTKPSCLKVNENGEISSPLNFEHGEPIITRR